MERHKENYSFYLFSELVNIFDEYQINKQPYDIQFEYKEALYIEYLNSPYNKDKGEYECITDFLTNKVKENKQKKEYQ
ncbi:MAG: hypothetical protein ACR2IJ_07765 [Fluviibacter sp.]